MLLYIFEIFEAELKNALFPIADYVIATKNVFDVQLLMKSHRFHNLFLQFFIHTFVLVGLELENSVYGLCYGLNILN